MKPFGEGLVIGMFVVLLYLSVQGAIICISADQTFMTFIFSLCAGWNLCALYKTLWEKPKCRS